MYTIFISHNYKDKPVVEPIAMNLASVFGRDEVFYDSWSIKPGDGIINQMNIGLENCRFVFFFVSRNSLASYMVNMEWQNALMKVSKGLVRLIPIKMDNSEMPAILTQNLYLDLFANGIDVTIRQMIDLVQGNDTFRPKYTQVKNLSVKFLSKDERQAVIQLDAEYFMEPISHFVFVTPNNEDEIKYNCKDTSIFSSGFTKDAFIANGIKYNAVFIGFPEALVPGFPQRVEINATKSQPLVIVGVMHEEKRNQWKRIL
ncbi:MAG: toll/interleukin-1 receptor domain-containing protein [Prevotella sp.]|jgi:hypothetical protein|nr:toll/interleukin-1 receptor domain-containing protein [Prevotella sp.]